MKMADWLTRLDAFLQFNEYNILKDAGTVNHDVSIKLAGKEYSKFRVIPDHDFDKEVKRITNKPKEKR